MEQGPNRAAQQLIAEFLPNASEDQQKLLALLQMGEGDIPPFDARLLQTVVHHDEDGTAYHLADYFREDHPEFIANLESALTKKEAASSERVEVKTERGEEVTRQITLLQNGLREERAADTNTMHRLEAAFAA
jgi:hypothetical protein